MREKNIGIFRTVQSKNKDYMVNNSLPFIVKVLEQQISGKYTKCILDENMEHEILGYTQYVHFTSPIRRMPDLLNQICWTYNVIKPEYINRKMMDFYETQISELDILNVKMKKIRRLQNDSHILHTVFNEMTVLDKIYTGIIISLDDDKINVYIDELQWLTSCWYDKNTQTYNKYDKIQCSLFLFEKEDQMRRKIRINIINKN
jgi:exoribonuclease R